ncbi:hypothetical protein HPP92_011987 [Vanilla planifolia]|uniref:Uncharacterized protein n=1 Tax=Vanilla planifolia TaxID=51239 RepID=A0A835QYN5_VANPL|nr:hypothetical protein HPP92_011987 [Vanilla planifolia]
MKDCYRGFKIKKIDLLPNNKRKETLGEDKMGYKMALIFLGIVIIGCSKVEAKNVEFLDITSATDAANGQWCQVCQDFITKSFILSS